MNENENKYLSLKTVAGLYGYTRDHLGLMIRQGKLKGMKLGSYYVTTNEWVADYLKNYADPAHPAAAGKFSNKFLTQAFTAKENKVSKDNRTNKVKSKTYQTNVQNELKDNFFSEIQKELLPSLQELSQHSAFLNNPYVILPVRKMEQSEREGVLRKISEGDESENEQKMA